MIQTTKMMTGEMTDQLRTADEALLPSAATHVFIGMFRPPLQQLRDRLWTEWTDSYGHCQTSTWGWNCPICTGKYALNEDILRTLHPCWIAGHFDEPVYKTHEEVMAVHSSS